MERVPWTVQQHFRSSFSFPPQWNPRIVLGLMFKPLWRVLLCGHSDTRQFNGNQSQIWPEAPGLSNDIWPLSSIFSTTYNLLIKKAIKISHSFFSQCGGVCSCYKKQQHWHRTIRRSIFPTEYSLHKVIIQMVIFRRNSRNCRKGKKINLRTTRGHCDSTSESVSESCENQNWFWWNIQIILQ